MKKGKGSLCVSGFSEIGIILFNKLNLFDINGIHPPSGQRVPCVPFWADHRSEMPCSRQTLEAMENGLVLNLGLHNPAR
jgi:hypothetical protein